MVLEWTWYVYCQFPSLEYIYESDTPLSLLTANGVVEAMKQINIWILALNEMVSPYVLEEPPDLLSMGRRVIDKGYSVSWPTHSEVMQVTRPDGKVVELTADKHIPYIDRDTGVEDDEVNSNGECV